MPPADEPSWKALVQAVNQGAPAYQLAELAQGFAEAMEALQPATSWPSMLTKAAAAGPHQAVTNMLLQQPQGMSIADVRSALAQALHAAAAAADDAAAARCAAVLEAAAAQGLAERVVLSAQGICNITPLMTCVLSGCSASIPILLKHCPEDQLTARDSRRMTALMHAAEQSGRSACIPLLLSHIVDTQLAAQGYFHGTALTRAAKRGDSEAVLQMLKKLLQAQGAGAVRPLIGQALIHAARYKQDQCCRALLQAAAAWGMEADAVLTRDSFGNTPLMVAALEGQVELITALLTVLPEEQLTARNENECGSTPLMRAARSGKAAAIPALLSHIPQEQLSSKNNRSCTPLHLAAESRQGCCIAPLLAHIPEQQLTAVDTSRTTPLMTAVVFCNADAVQALLQYIPDQQLAAVDRFGQTALHLAPRDPDPRVLQLLMSHVPCTQPDLDIVLLTVLSVLNVDSAHGFTSGAARKEECVRMLLSMGARLSGIGVDQLWPILQDVADRSRRSLVEVVVRLATDVRASQVVRKDSCGEVSGSGRCARGVCNELHGTATAPASVNHATGGASASAAHLVQAATQCDLQRLQRLLSFRDTPQPHLDQALTAALTAEVDEAAKAQRQRCAVLLLARGARLALPGQAEMQDSLSVLWPIVTRLAVTVYAGDAAAQAVQGVC